MNINILEAKAASKIISTALTFRDAEVSHHDSAILTSESLEAGATALGIANIVKAAVTSGEVKASKWTYTSNPMIGVHGLTGDILRTYSGKIGKVSVHAGGSTWKLEEATSVHLQGLVRRCNASLTRSTLAALPEGAKLKDVYVALEAAALKHEAKLKADKKAKEDNSAEVVAPVAPVEEVVPVENLLTSLESVLTALIFRQAELDASGWVRVDAIRSMINELKITNVPNQRVA